MSVYEDMKARLLLAGNVMDGSFALDNIAAVAVEIDRMEQLGINYMPNRFFPTLAWGEALTLAAENFGIYRKGAVGSYVELLIEGEAGAVVSESVKAAAGEVVFVCMENAVVPENGSVCIRAKCEALGSVGNVPAGAISEFVTTYEGLIGVNNPEAASGGVDIESDEELRQRVLNRWQNPSTGGNMADYLRWSMEVAGVSRARVTNPSGGKINVYIVGAGNSLAQEELRLQVQEHIDEVRPVGANVNVISAIPLTVSLQVDVQIEQGYEVADIESAIEDALFDYLNELSFTQSRVSYLKLADLLFAPGVKDVISYSVNGTQTSITIPDGYFPMMGEVGVTSVD